MVLFDEIEKAHPDVFNILLQILDEGTLTDSLGRRVDFRNTVIIMTSNLGTRGIESGGYGFAQTSEPDDDKIRTELLSEVKRLFNPEFLNRLDETVVFNSLTKAHLLQIVDLQLRDLQTNLASKHVTHSITKAAKERIIEEGYSKSFGARPMRRVIQSRVENVIAEKFLRGEFTEGGHISISARGKNLFFTQKASDIKDSGVSLAEEAD